MVYDIKHENCIIEFNGDYWHANPKIYNQDTLLRGQRVIDIWERDKLKLDTAKEFGFLLWLYGNRIFWQIRKKR